MDWFLYDNGPRHERVKFYDEWERDMFLIFLRKVTSV